MSRALLPMCLFRHQQLREETRHSRLQSRHYVRWQSSAESLLWDQTLSRNKNLHRARKRENLDLTYTKDHKEILGLHSLKKKKKRNNNNNNNKNENINNNNDNENKNNNNNNRKHFKCIQPTSAISTWLQRDFNMLH